MTNHLLSRLNQHAEVAPEQIHTHVMILDRRISSIHSLIFEIALTNSLDDWTTPEILDMLRPLLAAEIHTYYRGPFTTWIITLRLQLFAFVMVSNHCHFDLTTIH